MWLVAVLLAGLGPETPVAPLGPPVQAPSFMYYPDVASDGDGGFFAVWADKRFTGGDPAIIGTRVLPDGGFVDPRGLTISQLFGTRPQVRFIGGQWVVAWSAFETTWLRAFTPQGVFTGPALQVGPGDCADLRGRPDGGVLVVSGGGWRGGFLRRYGPGLSPIDPQALQFTMDEVYCPRVAGPLVVSDAPHPDGGRGTEILSLDPDDLPQSTSRLADVQPLSPPLLVPPSAPVFLGLSGSNELVVSTLTGTRALVFATPTVPGEAELVLDADGGLAVLALTSLGTALFRAPDPTGPWSAPTLVPGLNGFQLSLAVKGSSAFALSTGGQAQWFDSSLAPAGAPLQVARPFTYHQVPSVAVGGGTNLTAWREPSEPFSSIRAAFPGQPPFSLASPTDPGGRDCPSVAFDGVRFGVAWRSDDDIEFRTVDPGGALGPTLTLESQTTRCPALVASQGAFQLARARTNEVVVAGFFPDGGARGGWSVSTTAEAMAVSVALDDAGDGYVVWAERASSGESQTFAARKTGAAISSFPVCTPGPCDDPRMVLDGQGGAIVVSTRFFGEIEARRLVGATASGPVTLGTGLRFPAVAPVPGGALVVASNFETGEALLWQVNAVGGALDAGAPVQLLPAGEFPVRSSLAMAPFTLVTLEPDATRSAPQAVRRVWTPNAPGAACLGGWACASGVCAAGQCAAVTVDAGGSGFDGGDPPLDGGAPDGGAAMLDGGGVGLDGGALMTDGGALMTDGGEPSQVSDAGAPDGGASFSMNDDGGPPVASGPVLLRLGCDCQGGVGSSALSVLALLGLIRRRRATSARAR